LTGDRIRHHGRSEIDVLPGIDVAGSGRRKSRAGTD
jgi:hypothetical protein